MFFFTSSLVSSLFCVVVELFLVLVGVFVLDVSLFADVLSCFWVSCLGVSCFIVSCFEGSGCVFCVVVLDDDYWFDCVLVDGFGCWEGILFDTQGSL